MTDKELLELAAKAAGVPLRELSNRYDCWEETPILIGRAWEPLKDDGDALRLAVKLKLHIHIDNGYGTVVRRPDQRWQGCEAHKFGGVEAATRRAIVLAAAEIGKAMA